jgi:dipeptidyl aminopeptidase/acylaminoacyl peptidase
MVRNTAMLSDIYAVSVRDGAVRRLTQEARAADPDASPDGRTIVCTVQESGRRILATFQIPAPGQTAAPVPLLAEAATEFSAPRWSPDGRSIVAERRRLGGPSEIVIVDVATRHVTPLVSTRAGRNMTPVWLPGGAGVLFSSDRDGKPFRLYSADVATGTVRQLAGVRIGAQFPALSPDGRRLVFVAYTEDGYDLYSLRFDSPEWSTPPVPGNRAEDSPSPPRPSPSVPDRPSRTYSPWPTLAPRFWVPVVESDGDDLLVGGATAGFDALGRHSYWAAAGWSSRNRPFVQLDYAYTRWRPVMFASVSEDTDSLRDGDVHSRELGVGFLFPVRRVRWTTTMLAAFQASHEDFECDRCEPPVDTARTRRAARLGWIFSNAKSFGYSVSAEQGLHAGVTSELTRRALGADGDAGSFTADVRGYVRVVPRHGVLAARLAGASSWGDEPVRRLFSAGGSGPRPAGFGFNSDAIGLMRGFAEGDVVGYHATVVNVDYRVPLLQVQRGAGTLPLFMRQLHGAFFADIGTAWDTRFRRSELRRSFGAEIAADWIIGGALPITSAGGAAWRHDPLDPDHRGWALFGRIGRAF